MTLILWWFMKHVIVYGVRYMMKSERMSKTILMIGYWILRRVLHTELQICIIMVGTTIVVTVIELVSNRDMLFFTLFSSFMTFLYVFLFVIPQMDSIWKRIIRQCEQWRSDELNLFFIDLFDSLVLMLIHLLFVVKAPSVFSVPIY